MIRLDCVTRQNDVLLFVSLEAYIVFICLFSANFGVRVLPAIRSNSYSFLPYHFELFQCQLFHVSNLNDNLCYSMRLSASFKAIFEDMSVF